MVTHTHTPIHPHLHTHYRTYTQPVCTKRQHHNGYNAPVTMLLSGQAHSFSGKWEYPTAIRPISCLETRARPKAKPYKFTQQIAVNNDDMAGKGRGLKEAKLKTKSKRRRVKGCQFTRTRMPKQEHNTTGYLWMCCSFVCTRKVRKGNKYLIMIVVRFLNLLDALWVDFKELYFS